MWKQISKHLELNWFDKDILLPLGELIIIFLFGTFVLRFKLRFFFSLSFLFFFMTFFHSVFKILSFSFFFYRVWLEAKLKKFVMPLICMLTRTLSLVCPFLFFCFDIFVLMDLSVFFFFFFDFFSKVLIFKLGDVSALSPGGIRIGSSCMTSRGLVEEHFIKIANFLIRAANIAVEIQKEKGKKIVDFRKGLEGNSAIETLRSDVAEFAKTFPHSRKLLSKIIEWFWQNFDEKNLFEGREKEFLNKNKSFSRRQSNIRVVLGVSFGKALLWFALMLKNFLERYF